MRRGEGFGYDAFMERLTTAANWVVRIVGTVVFLWLVWHAFQFTQYMNPGGAELPLNVHDSRIRNLLSLAGAFVLLFGLYAAGRKMPAKLQEKLAVGTLVLTVAWVVGAGFWWISSVDRMPVGDQAFIYGGASYFLEGQYSFLGQGAYCEMYPHQLPLIFLVELFFRMVGPYNYFACQTVNVLLAGGTVCLGSSLVGKLTGQPMLRVGFHFLSACCLPMIFYTGWVYGDLPSGFLVLLAANLLVLYEGKPRLPYLAGILLSFVLAVMLRKNSLIFLVAFGLTAGIVSLLKKDKRLGLTVIAAVLCTFIATGAVNKIYEMRSGIEGVGGGGFPASAFISMGLQEQEGKYGWYTVYSQDLYHSADCDKELTDTLAREDIASRLAEMKENPGYTWRFFREKVMSQWNAPLYQSLYFASQYQGRSELPKESPEFKITGDYFSKVLGLCDGVQMVVYVGTLCYYLFAVKRDSSLLEHFLAVGILGGFFFSIIWEAKSRYALPYYLCMYPVAVVGYRSLFAGIMQLTDRRPRDESAQQEAELQRTA